MKAFYHPGETAAKRGWGGHRQAPSIKAGITVHRIGVAIPGRKPPYQLYKNTHQEHS
jgi:hypothetical protein